MDTIPIPIFPPSLQIPAITLLPFPITQSTIFLSSSQSPPMSAPISHNFRFTIDEETKFAKNPGIISIIEPDSDRSETNKFASLRRTLSADMSSTKWLDQNGISPMKKIASSEEISVQFDIWSSVLRQNAQEKISNSSPAVYVHPLVKSKSVLLSEKSLEICTENLGSETGSDGFSSDLSSENGETEEDRKTEQEQQVYSTVGKKSSPRSFPPPLPSLSRHHGGCLQMQSRRDNGRLILEAISIPAKTNFRAQRRDGRLVLTYVQPISGDEEFEEEESGIKEIEPKLSINVHRLALMVNKPTELNPTWLKEEEKLAAAKSLPPRPRVARPLSPLAAAAAGVDSYNAYEYFWRVKPKFQQLHNNGSKLIISKNPIPNEEKTLLMLRGCKETKRSFSFWEPYCIATS